ncbi:unnamed protein product [Didymodactylos carnosus]|uniref:p-glycoprotein n=1 Tax=Didymodactylos carnosus TaxID=1234261 RepID=A0A8S2D0Y8_9BILA|nr:unnamed protein product [Didymodactylos carnosus]CAF3638288.1 unnamed protein product [Didymodactylos carnosus]
MTSTHSDDHRSFAIAGNQKPTISLSDIHVVEKKIVLDVLDKARAGRTSVIIAHRLSTITNTDKVAVVDCGRVREEGTHEELLQNGEIYFNLAMAQEHPERT